MIFDVYVTPSVVEGIETSVVNDETERRVPGVRATAATPRIYRGSSPSTIAIGSGAPELRTGMLSVPVRCKER